MNEPLQPESQQKVAQSAGAAQTGLGSPALTEDLALALLSDRDLTPETIEQIASDAGVMQSRKVRMLLAAHPRVPRRIALRVLRELFTFELMRFALLPFAPADLKRIADERLLSRLASITLGERIALARRCSETVAGALLLDREVPVWQAALGNARLTERAIIKALQRSTAAPALVQCVSQHPKWSPRAEVRLALLRNAHTPFAKAIEFAETLPPAQLRDVLHTSPLPDSIKQYLARSLAG